jgi:hypothetical protein
MANRAWGFALPANLNAAAEETELLAGPMDERRFGARISGKGWLGRNKPVHHSHPHRRCGKLAFSDQSSSGLKLGSETAGL